MDPLAHYRPPHPHVLEKTQPVVDEGAATFLAASPFVVLATTSDEGTDASPRGGPPGFVRLLDPGRVALGDLSGNNRLDSFRNVVRHPEVGMLFLVPGVEETLRVNGRAHLSTEPAVLDATTVDGVRPKVALVVEVRECYVHCAKSVRRSAIWDPATWPEARVRPRAAAVLNEHLGLGVDPAVIEADLEAAYRETLWTVGGED